MFAGLCTLALLLPYVAATIEFQVPSGITDGSEVTLAWTASTTDDSSFDLELVNDAFHKTYAISNSVTTANGQITFTLPEVNAGSGFSFQAVAIGNITDILGQSDSFSIAAASSSSITASSTTSTATDSNLASSQSTLSSASTTSISSSTVSSASSATSSSATSTPTTFSSSGAASFKMIGVAPAAALVLAAVAGAVMVF